MYGEFEISSWGECEIWGCMCGEGVSKIVGEDRRGVHSQRFFGRHECVSVSCARHHTSKPDADCVMSSHRCRILSAAHRYRTHRSLDLCTAEDLHQVHTSPASTAA